MESVFTIMAIAAVAPLVYFGLKYSEKSEREAERYERREEKWMM